MSAVCVAEQSTLLSKSVICSPFRSIVETLLSLPGSSQRSTLKYSAFIHKTYVIIYVIRLISYQYIVDLGVKNMTVLNLVSITDRIRHECDPKP